MPGRDTALLKGGPRDGQYEHLDQTLVRLRFPDVKGSYVFTGVDNYYPHLRWYRWEPDE